jgi:hypothetical protein
MTDFTYNIDSLFQILKTRKSKIKKYLILHFKLDTHYIIQKNNILKQHGGHNKENILLKKEVYELILNTYNLKNRYITKVNNVHIVNPILMSIEGSTVGFIDECFKNITNTYRQYRIGNYFIDLYFIKFKLAIECDEFGHKNYNNINESIRQTYIEDQLKCVFIRFDPTTPDFSLPLVISKINKHIFDYK